MHRPLVIIKRKHIEDKVDKIKGLLTGGPFFGFIINSEVINYKEHGKENA